MSREFKVSSFPSSFFVFEFYRNDSSSLFSLSLSTGKWARMLVISNRLFFMDRTQYCRSILNKTHTLLSSVMVKCGSVEFGRVDFTLF